MNGWGGRGRSTAHSRGATSGPKSIGGGPAERWRNVNPHVQSSGCCGAGKRRGALGAGLGDANKFRMLRESKDEQSKMQQQLLEGCPWPRQIQIALAKSPVTMRSHEYNEY